MTNRAAWIAQNNAKVDSRGRVMALQLHRWLERFALSEFGPAVEQVSESLRHGGLTVAKAATKSELQAELYMLLTSFGLRQFDDDGRRAARSAGSRWAMNPGIVGRVVAEKEIRVRLVMADTEAMIKDSLRGLLDDALKEIPQPSVQEMSRRIARTWFGPPSDMPPGREGEQLRRLTANWQKPPSLGEPERLFSFDRAYTIARTELGQVQNQAIAEGFGQAGVERVRWLAYRDSKSGDRHHNRMNNHKPITVADMRGNDRSRWFELPSGIRCPYPQWMGLPAKESVNCRCTVVPA